jgi:hypothetical protein
MAGRLNCSEQQVRDLVKEGRIVKPFYIGGSPRWLAADADAYLHLLARGFFPPHQPKGGRKKQVRGKTENDPNSS